MRRILGSIFTLIGLLLLLYTIISFLSNRKKSVSPVPTKEEIKVIQISPSP